MSAAAPSPRLRAAAARQEALEVEKMQLSPQVQRATEETAQAEASASAEEAKKGAAKISDECARATRERDELRAEKREWLDVSERKDRERETAKASNLRLT
mgnify:CR=1 FL=1